MVNTLVDLPGKRGLGRAAQVARVQKVGTLHHMAKMSYGEREGQWRDTDIYELLLPKPEEKQP